MLTKKRTKRLGIVFGTACALVLVLAIMYHENLALLYYINFSSPKVLPTKYIRPLFKLVAEQELPEEAKRIRAIFHSGFDPSIFVEIKSEPEVIEKFLEPFLKLKLEEDTAIDPKFMQGINDSGHKLFFEPAKWQDKLGIKWFDQTAIGYGRLIKYAGPAGSEAYEILVDDGRNIVYIYILNY